MAALRGVLINACRVALQKLAQNVRAEVLLEQIIPKLELDRQHIAEQLEGALLDAAGGRFDEQGNLPDGCLVYLRGEVRVPAEDEDESAEGGKQAFLHLLPQDLEAEGGEGFVL